MNKEKKSILNLTVLPTPHQEFKSYSHLCEFLHLTPTTGNARMAQLKQLERYFSWTRDGNKYIVGEVYNQPLPYIENRGKNKPLTESQTLFNTIMLYELLYGAK